MASNFAFDGAYTAERAAALAGVPRSTVYYWARTELIVPSISPVRERLWSYADLMALRIVYWLRKRKTEASATPMHQIRHALQRLAARGVDLWSSEGELDGSTPIWVDSTGEIHLSLERTVQDLRGQSVLGRDFLDLLGPFDAGQARGPNLLSPRPHLRIIPGKLAGQPHLEHTRVSTLAISALAERGFDVNTIAALYPDLTKQALREAIELEQQLSRNLLEAA